jgi:hypothetical protein
MFVVHANKPEWGPGKVVAIRGTTLYIFFRELEGREARRFRIDSEFLSPALVTADPVLDNPPPFVEEDGRLHLPAERVTLTTARERFLRHFPAGFYDPAYIGDRRSGERHYKWLAHERYVELLGNGEAERQLAEGNVAELVGRAARIIGQVNLLSPFESAAFRDALTDLEAAERFFDALVRLLAAPALSPTEFEAYLDAVLSLPQIGNKTVPTWPVATILPFLAQPDRFLFLKPMITKEAAERLGFDIHYDATPNWKTYEALLRMANTYLGLLQDLRPRNLIDVQSFFWITSGGYEETRAKAEAR